jgi:hypothetical protein
MRDIKFCYAASDGEKRKRDIFMIDEVIYIYIYIYISLNNDIYLPSLMSKVKYYQIR